VKIAALAGGVGGAKLADGLAQCLAPEDLTIIVNTGDDFDHLGVRICPDLDTICYTLAGLANAKTGWGRAGESWNAYTELSKLGAPSWFRLGDRDLATHLERTRRLKAGASLTSITQGFCEAWGIHQCVLPMTDDRVETLVLTREGRLPFQTYFVQRRCDPVAQGFEFRGAEVARPAPGVIENLLEAETIIICPSNPWVSISPILAIRGVREALAGRRVVAVSPLIQGRAIKGPAAKMYQEMNIVPSALAVARHYEGILSHFVLDRADKDLVHQVEALGCATLAANTIMRTRAQRRRLALDILAFLGQHA
jgi:LPPG:FO 2-phospho-L-lactate transferase